MLWFPLLCFLSRSSGILDKTSRSLVVGSNGWYSSTFIQLQTGFGMATRTLDGGSRIQEVCSCCWSALSKRYEMAIFYFWRVGGD